MYSGMRRDRVDKSSDLRPALYSEHRYIFMLLREGERAISQSEGLDFLTHVSMNAASVKGFSKKNWCCLEDRFPIAS
jgi:hypothetical protein